MSADAPPSPPGRVRLEGWDRLRVLAALDTVGMHVAGEHVFFGFGLPLFLILAIALGVSKPGPRPTARFLSRRVDRILVPWVFWSLLLAGERALHTAMDGKAAFAWARPEMLLYGPRIHLWFLPLILVAGLLAHLAHRATGSRRGHPGGATFALLLAAALLALPAHLGAVGWPFEQWLFSVPALALGFALGRRLAHAPDLPTLRRQLLAAFGVFVAGALLVAWLVPASGAYGVRYAGGFGLLVLAACLPNVPDRLTRRLTPLMLGVYVLHPVVYLWVIKPALEGLSLGHVGALRVGLTFPATMLLVAALRRTRSRTVL